MVATVNDQRGGNFLGKEHDWSQ
ncbi:hypothetical protein Godav_025432 [Gossypium davidsonii]|uniref:Uncharacterized protein n=1 Tax=Gossypium davidsonii TaxID=34287 RepID=A0A7J8TCB9_GOSDV|nr:hypothetical protein [Gossypium davidsonii]